MDTPQPGPAAPHKALKYNKKSGLRFAGVPARILREIGDDDRIEVPER